MGRMEGIMEGVDRAREEGKRMTEMFDKLRMKIMRVVSRVEDKEEMIEDLNMLQKLSVHPEWGRRVGSLSEKIMEAVSARLEKQAEMGDVDGMLDNLSVAALSKIAELMRSEDEKTALDASVKLFYSAGYKPVERKVNLNASIKSMPTKELDAFIAGIFNKLDDKDKGEIVKLIGNDKEVVEVEKEKENE